MTPPRNLTEHSLDGRNPIKLLIPEHLHSGDKACEATHSLLENRRPIAPGLIGVWVEPSCHSTFVHQALARFLTDGSSELGIPPSNVKAVCSLYSGNPRQLEHAKTIIDATPKLSGVPCDVEYVPAQDRVNWPSTEGQLILFQHFNAVKGGCLIADQVIHGPTVPPDWVLNLNRISTKAKEADVQVILIVSAASALTPALKQVCDEYFEVRPCEADLEVQMAFTIDYPCISDLGIGLGNVMVSIKYFDGKFHYSYTPFISDTLDKRLAWTMRGLGLTLEEIGAKLKINKSSVLRRLKDLPPPRKLDNAEEWLSLNFEETSHCGGACPDSSTLVAAWDDGNPSGDADGA